jgi:DNA-binding PadR family transcriptional regulator
MPGELPVVLLALLADRAQGGYELLGELERRFGPAYRPSPGSVYPALSALRAEQLVLQRSATTKAVYAITARGRRTLAEADGVLDRIRARTTVALDDDRSLQPVLARFSAEVSKFSGQVDRAAIAQLGTRELELAAIAARGRRRSLAIMVLACIPMPFIVGWLNHDMSLVAMVPFVSLVGGISYSWSKWMRRPEDSQSIAFAGLPRSQRRVAYRSLRTLRPIEDPIVLTIVDSMQQHVQRTGWSAAITVAGVSAVTIALIVIGGAGAGAWPASAAVVVFGVFVVVAGRWLARRAGQVVQGSDGSS